MVEFRYCPECGAGLVPHIVGGDVRRHWFCEHCQRPCHRHPTVVVTSFIAHEKRLLWVQRALPPKRGLWAIPGGFLESGESLAEGAARELHEEAGVLLPPERLHLYMTGAITFINQVYVGFRGVVDSGFCDPGPEGLACAFFSREECPWDRLAYPEVNDSIEQAYADLEHGVFEVWQAEMTESRYAFRPVCQRYP